MNLKYYLRGLGLGIVVTAIIMGVAAGGKKESLTNEEIIAKAKELGMIENQVLTDYMAEIEAEEAVQKKAAEASEKETPEAVNNQNDIPEETSLEEDETETIEEGERAEADKKPEEAEPTIFLIRKGESPYKVSQHLEKEGLVSSADDFDTFLINNGYDRKIVASEYSIPLGADEETIAKIITGEKIE